MSTPRKITTAAGFVNVSAVASALGLNVQTVRRLWRSGRIPGYKIGYRTVRFKLDEVTAALASTGNKE